MGAPPGRHARVRRQRRTRDDRVLTHGTPVAENVCEMGQEKCASGHHDDDDSHVYDLREDGRCHCNQEYGKKCDWEDQNCCDGLECLQKDDGNMGGDNSYICKESDD